MPPHTHTHTHTPRRTQKREGVKEWVVLPFPWIALPRAVRVCIPVCVLRAQIFGRAKGQ